MNFIVLITLLISPAQAEGWFKKKIKERIESRVKEHPAPEARTDVDAKITTPGSYTFKLGERFYKLHVPLAAKNSAPLVLTLHGGAGNMEVQSKEDYYHLISQSDKTGTVVAFPNGYSKFKSGEFATWNAGKCCGDAREQNSDDVNFLKAVIAQIQKQVSIDPKKIFITGMSNGGMMAYRMACEATEVAGIAAVAGTDNTADCKPAHSVPILHIHAKDDDHVLITGGIGPASPNPEKVTAFTSLDETMKKWQKINHCSSDVKKTKSLPGVECFQSLNCQSPVNWCVTDKGGHSWPGGKKPMGGKGSEAISATDTIWEFFEIIK